MTDILFKCPECHKSLAADERGAGCQVKCPDCGKQVEIPHPEIAWECSNCHAQHSGTESYAGQTYKCPSCNRGDCVAALEDDEPKGGKPNLRLRIESSGTTQPVAGVKKCPFCRSNIAEDAVICVGCGTDFRTGKRVIVKQEKPSHTPVVVAVAVLLLIASVACFVILSQQKPGQSTAANAQTSRHPLASQEATTSEQAASESGLAGLVPQPPSNSLGGQLAAADNRQKAASTPDVDAQLRTYPLCKERVPISTEVAAYQTNHVACTVITTEYSNSLLTVVCDIKPKSRVAEEKQSAGVWNNAFGASVEVTEKHRTIRGYVLQDLKDYSSLMDGYRLKSRFPFSEANADNSEKRFYLRLSVHVPEESVGRFLADNVIPVCAYCAGSIETSSGYETTPTFSNPERVSTIFETAPLYFVAFKLLAVDSNCFYREVHSWTLDDLKTLATAEANAVHKRRAEMQSRIAGKTPCFLGVSEEDALVRLQEVSGVQNLEHMNEGKALTLHIEAANQQGEAWATLSMGNVRIVAGFSEGACQSIRYDFDDNVRLDMPQAQKILAINAQGMGWSLCGREDFEGDINRHPSVSFSYCRSDGASGSIFWDGGEDILGTDISKPAGVAEVIVTSASWTRREADRVAGMRNKERTEADEHNRATEDALRGLAR